MNNYFFYLLNSLTIDYPALNPLFSFMGDGLAYVAVVVLFCFLLIHKDKKRGVREFLMIIIVAIFAWFAAIFLKSVFDTSRPFVLISGVTPLFPQGADGAFPSGHATFFSALAMMMWFYHKRIAVGLFVIAIIIGVGRVISGVHFPIDILGGYILGILISIVSYFAIKRFLDSTENSPL